MIIGSKTEAIWKFTFPIDDEFELLLPKHARVLHADMQDGISVLWAIVDPSQPRMPRRFAIRGTGHDLPDSRNRLYISTFQAPPFVWHLFEITTQKEKE